MRKIFWEKVFKISLDGGFDCQNRDGTVAYVGCTFCSTAGSGDFAGNRLEPIDVQFEKIKKVMHIKWKNGKYIAYFQAFTNTHSPVSVLKEKYEAALKQEGVVVLSIATRPDCLPDDVMDYLSELNERTYLWVELGLQTAYDKTAELINRAHNYQVFVEGVQKLRTRGFRVCAHIINGLPMETPEMMIETAQKVAELDIQGIKIHLLHLLKGTPMVKQYEKGMLKFMTLNDYVNIVCDQLEILPPNMIIHRITGDGPSHLLIGPMWSVNKWEVMNSIDEELERRNSWQGKYYKGKGENVG